MEFVLLSAVGTAAISALVTALAWSDFKMQRTMWKDKEARLKAQIESLTAENRSKRGEILRLQHCMELADHRHAAELAAAGDQLKRMPNRIGIHMKIEAVRKRKKADRVVDECVFIAPALPASPMQTPVIPTAPVAAPAPVQAAAPNEND